MAGDTTRANRNQSNEAATNSDPPKARKRHVLRWRLLTMLATLAVLAWFLPVIVAKTPLLAWGVKLATTDLQGSVRIGSASLGWLSPVEVRDIEVKDKTGKPVLEVASVVGDQRLGAILLNYSRLGKFTLLGAKLSVAMRDDGTNVEDLLANYIKPKEKKPKEKASSSNIGVAVEIIDAEVSLLDEPSGLVWQAQKFSASLDMRDGPQGPIQADVATSLRDAAGTGRLAAGVKMDAAQSTAKLSVVQFPLGALRAIVARCAPGMALSGRLSSEATASWGSKAGKSGASASVRIDGLSLAAPAMQTDVLQLANLTADCQASWQSDRLDIERSSLECDVGKASLSGTVPFGGKEGLSLTAIAHQRQECTGVIDLARLAQLLPATLCLRSNMRIESGQVQWAFNCQPGPQGTTWHGQCGIDGLTATTTDTQRRIALGKPISAVLDAHEAVGGEPIVDRLLCDSDFLNVEGAGTTDNLNAKFRLSLDKLAEQMGQFVEMGRLQLAGDGSGSLVWKRSPQKDFDASLGMQFRGFQMAMTGRPLWREDAIEANASARGRTNFDASTRIDTASLNVKSGYDQIEAKLLEPVNDMRDGGVWPVGLTMRGYLQNWPARLAPWIPTMGQCQLAGGYSLQASAVASKQGGDLRQMGFAAQPLIVKSPWANLNEGWIEGDASGSWNQQQRRLQLPAASLKCLAKAPDNAKDANGAAATTVAVQAKDVVVAMPTAGPMELVGTLGYQGDVGRVQQWFVDPKVASLWHINGQLNGNAIVQQTAGLMHGTATTEVANLAIADSTGQQVREPIVRLVARGDYDTKSEVLQLSQCELTSSAVTAAAGGNIQPVGGRNNAQLEGMFNYDLGRLTSLLRPCIGPKIQLAGRGASSASYRGPFSLAEGSAAMSLHCDGANLYGFPLGAADVKATMAGGTAQIEPLDVAVSGGSLRLAPRLQLTSNPMVLSVPKGPLMQKIQINPAMCSSGLQYIAPALAGVTSAQGAFSIDLDDCRVPIGNLKKANIVGRMTVHSIVVGPGPMVRELATFMNRAAPAQLKRESVVPFQMVNGRVYHKNLELQFPDITIRSSGWVDLDQKMEITAQMPVPAKWQAGATVLANAVKNQTIVVPLRGTLAKPALDQKVVQQLTGQFMKKAAGNIIEGELNRLLTPRK
jgi:translocation and assembly module TamB